MDVPAYQDLDSHKDEKCQPLNTDGKMNQNAPPMLQQSVHPNNIPYQAPNQGQTQNIPQNQHYIYNPNFQQPTTYQPHPPMQNYQTPTTFQPNMHTMNPPTSYQPPIQNTYQPQPTPQNYQPHVGTTYQPINPPVYAPIMQQSSTNNVIVVQPTASPIVIERNNNNAEYPSLQTGLALAVLILNIFLPGIGTMVMGMNSSNGASWICIGIFQLLLAFMVIGWIWAVITGIICLSKARG
jgi:hypothetical protein